jgi:hypothetical protein
MADIKAGITTSFNGGEIAPYLAGRVDHEGFAKCIRKAVNGMPQIGGSMKKFYGTQNVHSFAQGFDNYVMIPFHHEDESILLVIYRGTSYGRVAAVMGDTVTTLNIKAPLLSDYQSLRYEQVNDVLICCCEECPPFRIEYVGNSESAEDSFRLVQIEFDEVPYFPMGYKGNYNGDIEIEGTTGIVTARIPVVLQQSSLKITYPDALPSNSFSASGKVYRGIRTHSDKNFLQNPTLGDITVSLVKTVNGTTTVLKSGVYNSYSEGRLVVDDPWRVRTYGSSVHYAYWRSNDFSYATFKNAIVSWFSDSYVSQPDIYIPLTSIADYDPSAIYEVVVHFAASHTNCNENNDPALYDHPTEHRNAISHYGLVMNPAAKEYRDVCSAQSSAAALFSDLNNLVGRKLKIYQNVTNDAVKAWYQGMSVSVGKTVVWSDGKYYLARSGETTKSVQPTHSEGIVSDGGVQWQYLHSGYITATILSVKNEFEMTLLLKDGEHLPVQDIGKVNNVFSSYRWSMWGANSIYPSQIFFNSGRLGFFTNSSHGAYYNLSRTDSYYDFSEDSHGEVLDTDAIQGLITGGSFSNKINWVISRENIYCGSACTEFVIGGVDGMITPSTVYCKPVSFTGGAKVAALKYMTLSMFVGAGGNNLNVVSYDYSSESYIPQDVSYIAGHLFESGIKKIIGVPRPDNCIYILMNDGSLVQLVDSVSEGVAAFSRIDLGKPVLDIAPVFSGTKVDVYVLRVDKPTTIDNTYFVDLDKFCISEPTYMLSSVVYTPDEDKEFVSSLLHIPYNPEDAPGTTVYVKDMESGQFVSYDVNDGLYTGRGFKNPFKSKKVCIGMEMPFELHGVPSVGSKLEGVQQKSVRFLVRLLDSGAFSYGSSHDFDKWYDYNNWNIADSQEWDSKHKLMTGDLQLPASFGYMQGQNTADGPYPNDTSVAFNVKAVTPEPFNLLMVSSIYV